MADDAQLAKWREQEIARRRSEDCFCEFDADPDEPDFESFHFARVCLSCGHLWWSLHCPHEAPRSCPKCGVVQMRQQAQV